MDPAEAEKIGLISRLVDKEILMAVALEIAADMLEKTPLGLRFTKEALNQTGTLRLWKVPSNWKIATIAFSA